VEAEPQARFVDALAKHSAPSSEADHRSSTPTPRHGLVWGRSSAGWIAAHDIGHSALSLADPAPAGRVTDEVATRAESARWPRRPCCGSLRAGRSSRHRVAQASGQANRHIGDLSSTVVQAVRAALMRPAPPRGPVVQWPSDLAPAAQRQGEGCDGRRKHRSILRSGEGCRAPATAKVSSCSAWAVLTWKKYRQI